MIYSARGINSFVERIFEKELSKNKDYSPKYFLDQLKQKKSQFFMIISATAGMGKSTYMTHLSLKTKEQNPDIWVVRIDLKHHMDALINQKDELTTPESAIDFISSKLLKHKTDSVEQELFKHLLEEEKVVLMLD